MKFNATVLALATLFGTVPLAALAHDDAATRQGLSQQEARHPAVARALRAMKNKWMAAATPRAQAVAETEDIDDDDEFETTNVILDRDGREHVRFDRRYKGLRVIGGDVVVHGDGNGVIKAMSRGWKRRAKLDTRPALSEVKAANAALKAFPYQASMVKSRELIVWAVDGKEATAWDVVVEGRQADGTPSVMHHVIHAGNGQVLASWDEVHTAAAMVNGRSLYSGQVSLEADLVAGTYNLRDNSRGGHYVADAGNRVDINLLFYKLPAKQTLVTNRSSIFGDGTTGDRSSAAADAAYGFRTTWDYFQQVHQRNGIDGKGRQAYSRVHYGNNYNNAFWQNACFCMTYGDGDGQTMKSMISLDVAGHEMAHGVTGSSAKLIYTGESGGLNEATSDIFGTMVEHHAANSADQADYLIGEKIMGPRVARGYLRSMINPSDDGGSADCWYASVADLGVHRSSGVGNHFFYLLAEGTNQGQPSRTCRAGDSRVASGADSVQGIGRQKAERIWYRALTVYMTSTTNFASARQATLKAAADLFGDNTSEFNAVAAAWTAVNVR